MKIGSSSRISFPLRCVVSWLLCASPAQGNELLDIGLLTGGSVSQPSGINAMGDVIVGTANGPAPQTAFRWTPATGMVSLGMLNGGSFSNAQAVNAIGDVVVGDAQDGAGGALRAFRWTVATGTMESLGSLNGGINSLATGVNAAGDVVVGSSTDGLAGNNLRAFRWTRATGMISLGTLGGYDSSQANDVNAAGDVVVGTLSDTVANTSHAFRWTDATGMTDLGALAGRDRTNATGVNATGDVVIGTANDLTPSNGRAFRWTAATGMESLGTINGGTMSLANDVNAAGDVVVGTSADGATGNTMRGFRWTPKSGMQSVEQWLADNGVTVSGATSAAAYGVNAEGNVVTGRLANNHAFIARVGAGGSGLIDVAAYNNSLMRVANAATLAQHNADLAMNGLHGNPMRGLLPPGRYAVWVGGDAGRQNSGRYDADQGIAEFGFAKSLNSNLQFNIALGHNYRREHTGMGDTTTLRSTYVLPELTYKLPDTSLYATVSGYYSDGDMEIKRTYLNAGTPVQSRGKPNVSTAGARLRVDWLDAASWGRTAFTPYASLTYMRTHLSGYTERGGGFPARWDSRQEHATTARVGLDAVHPLNDRVNLLGRLEAAHRFESEGAQAKGQVIGLYGFALDGQRDKRNWLRAGLGLESKLLDGVGAVMLNASTQGGASSYWINASYRWVF
ncbi:MAG TPA: autotransporter domain-containing protein [Candidimonas sp.]|nr:autotransporter domain-containing protein [Candidimonas sp.]